jgi:hypothetical protein
VRYARDGAGALQELESGRYVDEGRLAAVARAQAGELPHDGVMVAHGVADTRHQLPRSTVEA